tara:strand:+ start:2825 stop:3175 length:351 start_codon:yes stop_codon:yes gene_type:complete
MNFQTTEVSKNITDGTNYVYELYTMKGSDDENIQYGMEFERTILKYGVTCNPKQRYGAGHMNRGYPIRMNVLNSEISRGEAFYLESHYAMEYAKKYGVFPEDMTDRAFGEVSFLNK